MVAANGDKHEAEETTPMKTDVPVKQGLCFFHSFTTWTDVALLVGLVFFAFNFNK